MTERNEFKKLFDTEHLPPEHKEKVMKTIDSLKLFGDIVEMFSVRQVRTDVDLLGELTSRTKKKRNKS